MAMLFTFIFSLWVLWATVMGLLRLSLWSRRKWREYRQWDRSEVALEDPEFARDILHS